MAGHAALDPGLGGASLDDGPDGHGAEPPAGPAGPVEALEQRSGGDPSGIKPRPDPGHRRLSDVLDRALGLLVGLRAADRQGVRVLGLEIGHLERGGFGDSEEAVGQDGDKGGVPEPPDGSVTTFDHRDRSVRLLLCHHWKSTYLGLNVMNRSR